MDRSKLADLSEILSSIAIVFTLIFLTVEVRQNTNALHAQSRQSVLDAAQVELYFQAEHPGIALSAIKAGPLSAEENISLDAVLAALMRGREYSWLQHQDGAIDERQRWTTL